MKFDTLIESLLSEVTQDPGEKLPYHVYNSGDVAWGKKGGNLQGAPLEVIGNFLCGHCGLESLEGGPRKVGGFFNCSYNVLHDLKGAPELVEDYFDCDHNPLKSLEGVPEAKSYFLPRKFTPTDARKEVARRKFEKGLDKETVGTFGDFVAEL